MEKSLVLHVWAVGYAGRKLIGQPFLNRRWQGKQALTYLVRAGVGLDPRGKHGTHGSVALIALGVKLLY